MTGPFDTIVIGVGAMGSAAAYQLAKRGKRVLALERFGIPNTMGSSHGLTRLLRLAYAEGESYVPMVLRARELWIELGARLGETIFRETGSLDIGTPGAGDVAAAAHACRIHGLDHEILDAGEVHERFPAWHLPASMGALHQPGGGFVACEAAIVGHVRLALAHGADIRAHTRVIGIEETGAGTVRVATEASAFEAGRAILSAGAWAGHLVPDLRSRLDPRRIPVGWYATARPDRFTPDAFPIWTLDADEGGFYGAPTFGHPGVKLGGPSSSDHPLRFRCEPEGADRMPGPDDDIDMRKVLARYLPDANGPALMRQRCFVTFTANGDFLIDQVPDMPSVLAVSPCSGHGFKFASVIGEIAADLVTEGTSGFDLSRFAIDGHAEAFAAA